MKEQSAGYVTFRLRRIARSMADRGIAGCRCGECDEILDLCQPDESRPGRLLGVCGECGAWYVADLAPDRRSVILLEVPGPPPAGAEAIGVLWPSDYPGAGESARA